jgi:glycosyltransferase involved in cell wall biosynthesis
MLAQGLSGDYEVVPNVVNVQRFKPLEQTPRTKTKLIHISSLNDREKNVSGLIRAFAKALQLNQELELNIVGEGVDKVLYQNLVSEFSISKHVNFIGRLMADELVKVINANDALIMFSNYETFSLVIIEAFACGKPVITSNAGAIASYMKSELGIMVDKNNEDQLKEAILNFTKRKSFFDKKLIRNFATDNYSYEKIGEKLSTIYRDVLK